MAPLNTKEDILKNVGNQTVLVPIDFYCIFFCQYNGTNGNQNCFPSKQGMILQCFLKVMNKFLQSYLNITINNVCAQNVSTKALIVYNLWKKKF